MQRPGIYVERLIRSDIEKVWEQTQRPELHEPWDLRFTKIEYLPRVSEAEPERFKYTTRIGFGLQIAGQGESTGNREETTGLRTSALKFWSADPKSLIEEGSGYWQYIPTESGVRFLTWYDYRTRFGPLGRLFDTSASWGPSSRGCTPKFSDDLAFQAKTTLLLWAPESWKKSGTVLPSRFHFCTLEHGVASCFQRAVGMSHFKYRTTLI